MRNSYHVLAEKLDLAASNLREGRVWECRRLIMEVQRALDLETRKVRNGEKQ